MKKKIILIIGIMVLLLVLFCSIQIFNNTKKPAEDNGIIKGKEENNTNIPSKESFVATVLEETTTYMIVEPNEDEQERKSSDKIVINYGTEHIDYLFGIGRKVIINYTGYIKETYPAQIDTDDILINGYEEFELTVKNASNQNKTKIASNQELDPYSTDCDLYYYGLEEVNITIDNKTIPLEEALKTGKMTLDGLIIKANKDIPNPEIYKDGGSMEYHYDNYTIIKMHKLDGNRDVYIGTKDMTMRSIQK
ncbi:MAG: hypothetical protein HFJ26_00940 [Clostridia bacterium]|nr:hypothetical protein [Clostridia bacterium]